MCVVRSARFEARRSPGAPVRTSRSLGSSFRSAAAIAGLSAALSLLTHQTFAATGSGELSLDRAAVAAIIAAGLPSERVVPLPVGQVTLALTPPKSIRFIDGGLEGELRVMAKELGVSGAFLLRFVPRVEGDQVLLDLVRATPQGAARMLPDVASIMPPVAVPNDFQWMLQLQGGEERQVSVTVSDVRVNTDRMVIAWRMTAGDAR